MTWTCLEFVEVQVWYVVTSKRTFVVVQHHFQVATVPLEDINPLPRIFAFPIGLDF